MGDSGINTGILLLCLINFGFIALLPRKFFKQGAKLNAHFWLTAAPLFVCPAALAASFLGFLPPWMPPSDPWAHVMGLLAVMVSSISIVMLGMSIGTHRVPIHMFHDEQDKSKPSHLVTYGPYRYIRHPIYSSYLMGLFSALLFCPQIGTALCFLYGVIVLGKTAAQEEVRLSHAEDIGEEYREYMKQTGRFLPPLSAFHMRSSQVAQSKQETTKTV